MVRGQIAYIKSSKGSVWYHARFQSENRQKGKRCRVSQSGQFQFGLYTGNCCYDRIRLTSLINRLFCCTLVRWERRYSIQGNTLIMSHKLAPLGRTHIRHGSSTPEANSKSSSPLKEWIHTHNWGDIPSVSPELKQLSGKNTVTREVVHMAEAARFDSSSSSSDDLVTKMHVARASVASVSSVSSKHIIAPKVASKHVVSKEPVNKSVNQSIEKVLAARQKVYEEAKAKK